MGGAPPRNFIPFSGQFRLFLSLVAQVAQVVKHLLSPSAFSRIVSSRRSRRFTDGRVPSMVRARFGKSDATCGWSTRRISRCSALPS